MPAFLPFSAKTLKKGECQEEKSAVSGGKAADCALIKHEKVKTGGLLAGFLPLFLKYS
ncbi:MAG: hypothetical protein LPK21_03645 [Hymenobacteraceae bacterium]|nr:hypothetical protein [Hymenobacteraceae bacterium]